MLDDIDRGGCDRVAEHMCNLAASVGVAMRCLFTADSALGCGLSVSTRLRQSLLGSGSRIACWTLPAHLTCRLP